MFHSQLVGNDLHAPTNQQVENDTGTSINALIAVTYNGIGTNYPSIIPANGSLDKVRGITQTIINPATNGYVTSLGFMIGNASVPVNTTPWVEGTVLYASSVGILQTTPNGPPVATVYLSDAVNGVIYVENSFITGGSGTGDVIGPGSSTNLAIPTWNGTTGTVLNDNPQSIIQPGGTIQTQAVVTDRQIASLVTIPSEFCMITSGVEIDGGSIDIEADGELVIL